MGAYGKAIEDYSDVIARHADAGDAWAGRAEALCQLGDAEASTQDRLRGIELGVPDMIDMVNYLDEKGYLRDPTRHLDQVTPALHAWTIAGCP